MKYIIFLIFFSNIHAPKLSAAEDDNIDNIMRKCNANDFYLETYQFLSNYHEKNGSTPAFFMFFLCYVKLNILLDLLENEYVCNIINVYCFMSLSISHNLKNITFSRDLYNYMRDGFDGVIAINRIQAIRPFLKDNDLKYLNHIVQSVIKDLIPRILKLDQQALNNVLANNESRNFVPLLKAWLRKSQQLDLRI